MLLVLRNAYPQHLPADLTNDEVDELEAARERITMKLAGVESMHVLSKAVSVTFGTRKECETARARTGWVVAGQRCLEASTASGREHATIVAGKYAYRDFDLIPD
jgi:hypothetical protein